MESFENLVCLEVFDSDGVKKCAQVLFMPFGDDSLSRKKWNDFGNILRSYVKSGFVCVVSQRKLQHDLLCI